ncbi:MAG: 50S ribosomal protein L23 [Actinomycetota bacterium]
MTAKNPRDVILRPVISEKSHGLIEENSYTFVVDPRSNKVEIRQAVEQIWGVKVLGVNTVKRRGKLKRNRMVHGRRPDSKRAIVRLAEGDKIEIFETR